MTDFKWIASFLMVAILTPTLQAETHCPGNNASVPFASRCQTIVGAAPVNHPDPNDSISETCTRIAFAELPSAPKPLNFSSSSAMANYSGVTLRSASSSNHELLAHPRRWMSVGFAIDASARILDAYSTNKMLKTPTNHEKFLPDVIAHHEAALYGYGASVLFAEFIACRTMAKHHHEKLARRLPLIDASSVFPWALHNLTLPTGQPLRGLHRIAIR